MSSPSYLLPMHGGISTMGEYYVNIFFKSSLPSQETLLDSSSLFSNLSSASAYPLSTPSPTLHQQVFRVQVDTGSSSLLIPSNRCKSCHQSKYSNGGYDDMRIIQSEFGLDLDDLNSQRIMCNSSYCGYGTCSSAKVSKADQHIQSSKAATKKAPSSSSSSSPSKASPLGFKPPTFAPVAKHNLHPSKSKQDQKSDEVKEGKNDHHHEMNNNADYSDDGDELPLIQSCPSGVCSVTTRACCSSIDKDDCGFYLRYGVASGGDDDDSNGGGSGNKGMASEYKVTAEGKLMRDKMGLDTLNHGRFLSSDDAIIYIVLDEKGPWPSKVDGILGLGYPSLNCNPTCSKPAFETIPGGNSLFTICMGDVGGKLLIGSNGMKENLVIGDIQWAPILSGPIHTFYTVELTKLIMDNEGTDIVEIAAKMAMNTPSRSRSSFSSTPLTYSMKRDMIRASIIDSGTTLLMLNEFIYEALVIRLRRNYCHIPGICGPISKTIFTPGLCLLDRPQYRLLPTLKFSFGNKVQLVVPPELYFIRYLDTEVTEDESFERGCKKFAKGQQSPNDVGDDDDGSPLCYVYCFGIQSSGLSPSIIGDAVMRGFTVVFDRKASRIGFASPNRTTCGSVADIDDDDILLQGGSGDDGDGIYYQNRNAHRQRVYFIISLFIAAIASVTAFSIIANVTGLLGRRSEYQPI